MELRVILNYRVMVLFSETIVFFWRVRYRCTNKKYKTAIKTDKSFSILTQILGVHYHLALWVRLSSLADQSPSLYHTASLCAFLSRRNSQGSCSLSTSSTDVLKSSTPQFTFTDVSLQQIVESFLDFNFCPKCIVWIAKGRYF